MDKEEVWSNYPFDLDSIEQLSPEKRTPIIRSVLKKVLNEHKEGVNASTMSDITGLSVNTVRKHMEHLTAVREAYRKDYGPRHIVYFPNGKLVHEYSDRTRTIGPSIFSFQRIENIWGQYVYVQERKKDPYSNKTTTVGGVLIERDSIDKFIEVLQMEVEEWVNENDKMYISTKGKIGR